MAKQLSIKWKTDAGPRIRCMRDNPPEPQVLVLEQANLPPKSRALMHRPEAFLTSAQRFLIHFLCVKRQLQAEVPLLDREQVTLTQTT